ncbi:ABC transporter ATP-binding protein [Bordetella sp. BOR01]|uniref:ABC transporter ATP-binding protein n=1 Tax=Bordetella sp. BOR01 TaxID=2854779 RepID=UPI001C47016E|nr:ABC transporter ATP-binding protein [Bordetella sp. BOR01]MBV7483457.1 ABC transporter ATP-binding protein [Bordetella sp. BOR01]
MSFLKLNRVSKNYGALQVVRGIDLAIEKGEFVSLLGPSGCGKTTTLQMIAGFAEVSAGTIELDGRDITHAKPNTRGLGVVFQSYALFPHMTVFDNVAFGLSVRKVPRVELESRTRAALELVKLDAHGTRFPRELSGGQRQRVALARALVIKPPVLLLDEPLSNLDAKLREEMQYELRRIQRHTGTTTILVTHDQSEALSISDRVVVMHDGRATQIDKPYQIYEYPDTQFISQFVGKTNLVPGAVSVQQGRTQFVHGELEFAIDGTALRHGEHIQISLRPEKLQLAPAGGGKLDARVYARFFLGSQWLYELDSALGRLILVTPNDGADPLEEGESTGLDWSPAAVRVLAAESAVEHIDG